MQVRRAVAVDRVLKQDGTVTVTGVIPQSWDEYLGATGTMNNHTGWVTAVVRTGNDDVTVHLMRRDESGDVEPIPADIKVRFTLDLVGTQND